MSKKLSAILGASSLFALAAASGAAAQTPAAVGEADAKDRSSITTADEIVVIGSIGYRNRTLSVEPTLEYGEEYFQRFEPLTAGDALKRVPSVTFLSDVIESDGARLRGLDPGYTQILINGERVPGGNVDRSFFLDRIPAELIERVEIVRSSSARRTGDAVAGTLNIVLRDGFALEGAYLRGGALRFDDATIKPTVGAVWGGEVGPGRLLLGFNLQGRYNPKEKLSLRYGDSPENNPNFATDDFDNREDQSDIRDGQDISFNADYEIRNDDGSTFEISGFYVNTDRTETERSFEYDDPTAITLRVPIGNLLTDNAQVQEIDQQNYSSRVKYERDMLGGRTKFRASTAGFFEKRLDTEEEIDFDRSTPRFTGDREITSIKDREYTLEASHDIDIAENTGVVFGVFWQNKDRDIEIVNRRNRFNVTSGVATYNQFLRTPNEFATPYVGLAPAPGGVNTVEETRLDGFALVEGTSGRLSFEAGVRYESTDVTVDDFTVTPFPATNTTKYGFVLPSAHIKFDLTEQDRITISGARTARRPNLNFISPALLEAELGDNDFLGNPNLRPETAWGADVGYERRLGRSGVVGVNFFYRAINDLVEVANTGAEGSEGPGTFVLTPENTGNGKVYGVEFDLSTPLTFIGLPNTGIFANFSWLESDINDVFGSRRFNDQSNYVYNAGLIHDLPTLGAAFGATYRKQGDAFGRIIGEEVTTTYGADLEVFVEKRFAKKFTLRFVGSNLLNGSKDEIFNKFTTIDDQISRTFDEFELETEQAGPWFQLVGRLAF